MRWISATALAGALSAGCGAPVSSPEPIAEAAANNPPGLPPLDPNGTFPFGPDTPPCDTSITVQADGPALLVNDPAVLEKFTLKRVLEQIIARSEKTGITAEEMLKRMFDTQNTEADAAFADATHCDSAGNGAFKNSPAVDCPRAEGALAKSSGLFTPGHKDYFAPVALVNRFDLASQGAATCGEFRIVFAKQSGLTDPNDRVFIIFEGALANPSFSILECRSVAKWWAGLEAVADDPEALAARLETFYFTGIDGFAPLVDANHFGLLSNEDDPYGISRGQVRLSQRMQDPWELRELRVETNVSDLPGPQIFFSPVTVKNNPMAELFDPANQTQKAFSFQNELIGANVEGLARRGVARIRMATSNEYNTGESAVSGAAQTDYVDKVLSGGGASALSDAIEQHLKGQGLDKGCPPDDPLTSESIIRRATTQSCAGCHAPERFLGEDRKIGCGLVWPSAMGEVHINEKGELSPALTDAFLPRRASVLATFLQSCDWPTIYDNLQPGGFGGIPPK